MDRTIVDAKLDALRHAIKRIEARTPANLAALLADEDVQDILVLNLAKAVQTCVDIGAHLVSDTGAESPQTMGSVFSRLAQSGAISSQTAHQMRLAVGFRNLAVHRYGDINWQIVLEVCRRSVADLEQFAGEITVYVDHS